MYEIGIKNKTNRIKIVNEWRRMKNNKYDEYWSHKALPEITKQIDDDNII